MTIIARIAVPESSRAIIQKYARTKDMKMAVRRLKSQRDIEQSRVEMYVTEMIPSDVGFTKVLVDFEPFALGFIIERYSEEDDRLMIDEDDVEHGFLSLDLRLRDHVSYQAVISAKASFIEWEQRRYAVERPRMDYWIEEAVGLTRQRARIELQRLSMAIASPNLLPFPESMVRYHVSALRGKLERLEGQRILKH